MKSKYDIIRDDTVREIAIHVTQRCNLSCRGCYASVSKDALAQELSVDDLRWINNNFHPEKTVLLGGEPLMYDHLEDALAIFHNITISTNGYFVPKQINLLKEHEIKQLQICLHPDTYIQLGNGIIEKIKNINPPSVISADFDNYKLKKVTCSNYIKTNSDTLFEIRTRTSFIKVTDEHKFPIINSNGEREDIKAKYLRKGDFLLLPKKIPFKGEPQKLPQVKPTDCPTAHPKQVNIPKYTTPELTRFLGYMLGDGLRIRKGMAYIAVYDKSKKNIMAYRKSGKGLFGIEPKVEKMKTQNTYQLIFFSSLLERFFSKLGMDKKSKDRTIPKIIHKVSNDQLATFIAGLYDAEGTASNSEILISSSSEDMIKKLQLLLKRFGILSAIDNKVGTFGFGKKYDYFHLRISNPNSIQSFSNNITLHMFSEKKRKKFIECATNKSAKGWIYERYPLKNLLKGIFDDLDISMSNYLGAGKSIEYRIKKAVMALEKKIEEEDIPVFQKEVAEQLRVSTSIISYWINGKGYRKDGNKKKKGRIAKIKDFYRNDKKKVILETSEKIIGEKINKARKKIGVLKNIINCFYFDEIVEIKRIQHNSTVYDLSVPETRNFIANGIITHNSIEGKKPYTDYIRGKGSYERAIQAGKIAKDNGVNCYFRVGYCKQNLKDIKWLLKNISTKMDIPLALFPRTDHPPLKIKDQIYLFDLITSEENGSIIAMPHFWVYLGKKGRCNAGSERLNFTYDRRITPCHMMWDYYLGKIGDPISVIRTARDVFIDAYKQIKESCLLCKHADVCRGGCLVTPAHIGCPLKSNFSIRAYIGIHDNVDVRALADKVNRLTDLVKDAEIC